MDGSFRVGFQGEELSYSHQAAGELFPECQRTGLVSFSDSFAALERGVVDRLVLPIENSTTGSVLPVLDRLLRSSASIVAEHMLEVRHALLGVPGSSLDAVTRVRSHTEALGQAELVIAERGWKAVVSSDTAGAVREVAELGDPHEAALAPEMAAERFGLEVLATEVMDRWHNTTRFAVLAPGPEPVALDADKTTISFITLHQPGALALALTELGLRGANLTRIESRPSEEAWRHRFFVDLMHAPGPDGYAAIFEPMPATLVELRHLGTYRAATAGGLGDRSVERP
jgi:prephenate dehydratase